MKRKLVVVGITFTIVLAAGISILAWKALTITDPYLVKPLTSSPALPGATVSYSLATATRTLSIVTSNDVVVVADPGASFRYEVLWLVERPKKDGASTLMEYKCKLPQYAAADHINPIGSQIPPKIQQVADGER
jgi:hypothetical protein